MISETLRLPLRQQKEGGHYAQIALATLGDAYTLDYWKNIASEIEHGR